LLQDNPPAVATLSLKSESAERRDAGAGQAHR